MKKYTLRFDTEVRVEKKREPLFRHSIRDAPTPPSGVVPGREENAFRYASVCETEKHRCRVCGAPFLRTSIRRVVLCPACGAWNELK
jgi:rubrerythrin